MASKKNKPATTSTTNLPALRIGTRIRCTDDGVTGRIVWANAVAVKIKWDDGEQVTWKRDTLGTRPIEILDDEQPAAPETPAAVELLPAVEPTATTEQDQETPVTMPAVPEQTASEPEPIATEAEPTATAPATEPVTTEPITPTTEPATTEPVDSNTKPATPGVGMANAEPPATPTAIVSEAAAQTPAKPKRQRKAPAEPKEKKPSALNAAAKVLAEEGRPMTCQELITAMAAKGYWTSPGGQTPAATLYSAILRELTIKGAEARFVKTERGKFAHKA